MKLYIGIISMCICTSAVQAQDWALEQLENSPRHQETITIQNGDKALSAFVVYPEVSEKATAIILIHENRGLNDWARSMADQMAGAGFIVIAPDFISGMAPDGGNTPDFDNSDAAREAIYELTPEQVTSDLDAVFAYAKEIPAANGKVAVMGFCWGGSQTFRYATNNKDVEAFFVFYGTGPSEAEPYQNIEAPVYGFYGGDDNRVNATIEASQEFMEEAGNEYEPIIYPGAGHGFMRSGQDPEASEANAAAYKKGFDRLVGLLKSL